MCIAILNTKKAGSLPKSYIKNSWENNNMGAGLLWSEDGKLKVFKSYDYNSYLDKYYEIRENKSIGNIVLHFRIATSGYKGEHNLHPFLVNNDLGFVHNGVIFGLGNKEFSDTYEFNTILGKFKHDFTNCDVTKYFISNYIGSSKLIFLNSKDEYTIINEENGHWKDDNWFSNDSYKEYNDFVYYGNKKVDKKTETKYSEFDYVDKDDEWSWDIYNDVCNMYGLDPEDEQTYDLLDYYMELNFCDNIEDLWCKLYDIPTK